MCSNMKPYFLNDGSLIIDKPTSIQLISSDQFEIVRTIGCHYLSHLSGKEVYDFLVAESLQVVKNELSSCKKSLGTGDKKAE